MPRRYEPQVALGIAVKSARRERDLTQKELAAQANVERTWLSHLENGRANPSYGTLRRIATALDLRLSELIATTEDLSRRP